MKLVPYLYFPGTCAAALEFYAAAGLGRIDTMMRFRDGPPMPQTAANPDHVMNATFSGDGVEFMASDGSQAKPMAGVALTLDMTDLPRAQALFAALSDGGTVTMPMARQFWGADFGTFTDRFAVQWQINCAAS